MPDITEAYDREQIRNAAATSKRIKQLYEKAIQEITAQIKTFKYKDKPFKLSDYPLLKKKVDATIKKMHAQVYAVTVNSIKESWDIANAKNNAVLDKRIAGRKVSKGLKAILYDPNTEALTRFIDRKERGLNLSGRVWNTLDPFKHELEQSLGLAIAKGQSAIDTAKQVKQYLNEPNKLFRRVRSEDGKLVLSQAAREYHPGRGVYRSSYKNALRLTRTENNLAYRTSDHERWQTLPFVIGFEVRLSKAHPKYDICDSLVGKYPKNFKFTGWHPQCLCNAVPILNDMKNFEAMEDALLNDTDFPEATGQIVDTPKGYKNWIKDNSLRVDGWKNKPYWVRDNQDWYKDAQHSRSFSSLKEIDSNTDFGLRKGIDSFNFYRTPEGDFTPSRKKLHDEILNSLLADGSTETGTAYMLGGAPANGKSTLIDSGLLKHPGGVLKVDPDEIKKKLPEYRHLVDKKDLRAASYAHEESSYLAKELQKRALERKWDVLSDGIADGSLEKMKDKVAAYQKAGLRTKIDYTTLDTDLSLKLAEARAKRTGREVPKSYILDMNREIANLVPQLVRDNVFDELRLWDTNINGKPRLILSHINGKTVIHNKKLYADFLRKKRYGKD